HPLEVEVLLPLKAVSLSQEPVWHVLGCSPNQVSLYLPPNRGWCFTFGRNFPPQNSVSCVRFRFGSDRWGGGVAGGAGSVRPRMRSLGARSGPLTSCDSLCRSSGRAYAPRR